MKKMANLFLVIYILGGIILAISISFRVSHYGKEMLSDGDYAYDTLFENQWYLHDNLNDTKYIEEYIDENGFVYAGISFRSNVDLGVVDFWKENIDADEKELVIALLDTRVNIEHEDLYNHIWINKAEIPNNSIDDDKNGYVDDYFGWNFNEQSNSVNTFDKEIAHGTHCAGIIVADHNGIGIMGILGNSNVKIMVLPIYGEKEVEVESVVEAIQYANVMGADICNISGVVSSDGEKLTRAIENTEMIFVVAAGNFQNGFINGLDLKEYKKYPACCVSEKVITVASIDENKCLSDFSNYGADYIDIAAPGENIYSTLPNNTYGYMSGTSMSAPIVCGVLGAYYYSGTNTIEEAAEKMFANACSNKKIDKQVNGGRIIHYKLQKE